MHSKTCQNGDSADTEREASQLSYCRMGLATEMGPNDQSHELSHHWAKSNPEFRPTMYFIQVLNDLKLQISQEDWSSL